MKCIWITFRRTRVPMSLYRRRPCLCPAGDEKVKADHVIMSVLPPSRLLHRQQPHQLPTSNLQYPAAHPLHQRQRAQQPAAAVGRWDGGSGMQECAGCGCVIAERYLLRALDRYWHEDCLKCSCCDCRLGEVGSTLFTKANLLLCRRDYLRYIIVIIIIIIMIIICAVHSHSKSKSKWHHQNENTTQHS